MSLYGSRCFSRWLDRAVSFAAATRRSVVNARVWVVIVIGCAVSGCSPQASESTHAPRPDEKVIGQVVADDGPVQGARVRKKGDTASVLTDSEGRFELPISYDPDAPPHVTAWKKGYYIGGGVAKQQPIEIQLNTIPDHDFEDYEWVDPTPDDMSIHSCGNCHEEIYQEWKSDGHANSANNRHFLNLYDGSDWHGNPDVGWSLVRDYPEGIGVCNACHIPSAKLDDLAISDIRDIKGVPRLGVHCDFCHKVEDVAESNIGLTHGRFGLSLLRPDHGQVFFGPLDDVDRGEDVFSPLQSKSRFCASCHEGVVFGVHVYSTYSEWLASSAPAQGKECQTCHMKPTGKMTNFAPGVGGIERDPNTLASHAFIQGGRAELLKSCLKVTTNLRRESDRVHVEIHIKTHNVGHRVPTGFLERQLLLVVDATPSDDGEFAPPMAGPRLPPSAGDLASRAGRMFAKQQKDPNAPIAPFWRLEGELIDTRLVPDTVTSTSFEFPSNVKHVRVRLIHRRFWDQVAKERKWPDNDLLVHDQLHVIDR